MDCVQWRLYLRVFWPPVSLFVSYNIHILPYKLLTCPWSHPVPSTKILQSLYMSHIFPLISSPPPPPSSFSGFSGSITASAGHTLGLMLRLALGVSTDASGLPLNALACHVWHLNSISCEQIIHSLFKSPSAPWRQQPSTGCEIIACLCCLPQTITSNIASHIPRSAPKAIYADEPQLLTQAALALAAVLKAGLDLE